MYLYNMYNEEKNKKNINVLKIIMIMNAPYVGKKQMTIKLPLNAHIHIILIV